ncbi:epimerase [Arthrobacter sp. MYb227]|uniref:SDR family oxidoreductase n=1 Tax=Arthrobacter sp. MYb227 TaxID=1848601 RepID=UPI000CFD8D41|nr:aldehyde reductase [Arthrobacter sp. MYb227]PQZ93505.1 epimerase [Arthrobacter sp. MYb227]
MSNELVLVTGGSGVLGAHCINALLAQGYRVRTTVRDPDKGTATPAGVQVFAAELTNDAGWDEAVAGCDFVLHTASLFPLVVPEHEDDLMIPAREGALRVLRVALAAGVKRVVLTSSFAAIGYGNDPHPGIFTEADWSNPEAEIGAYPKSKTLAERAAWDFVAGAGAGMELATINPVAIIGPVLGPRLSTSIRLVQRMVSGGMPGLPKISLPLVDVRDVADLHVLAMSSVQGARQRFLATSGDAISMQEMGQILRGRLGSKIPTRSLPDILIRVAARWMPELTDLVPRLGVVKHVSSAKAERILGWNPRPVGDSLVETVLSLKKFDLL